MHFELQIQIQFLGSINSNFLLAHYAGKLEADVVVIGSGIGGLCCAGLLARYEKDVLVLESHDQPGGAAHSFEVKGYKFDSGPSLFSGFQSRGPQANPLAQVNLLSLVLFARTCVLFKTIYTLANIILENIN